MPNPHFQVQVIGRSMGRSAVASAAYRSGATLTARPSSGRRSILATSAYRSGERLRDQQLGLTFDYRRKEQIAHVEIAAPDGAPPWARDREPLWNAVEASEKRKDAQLARDLIVALPRELTTAQNVALVREFVAEHFVGRGMVADFAIHESDAADGARNPHAHIMLTLRDIGPDGFGKKQRAWNDPGLVAAWRDAWAETTNRHLEAAGSAARVDLRSLAARGIDKEPAIHLGYGANGLERKGIATTPGDRNRAARQSNALREVAATWLAESAGTGWGGSEPLTGAVPPPAARSAATAAHQRVLGDYLRVTVQTSAELVARLGRYVDRGVEAARDLYGRLARWGADTPGVARERGRELDRGRDGREHDR